MRSPYSRTASLLYSSGAATVSASLRDEHVHASEAAVSTELHLLKISTRHAAGRSASVVVAITHKHKAGRLAVTWPIIGS